MFALSSQFKTKFTRLNLQFNSKLKSELVTLKHTSQLSFLYILNIKTTTITNHPPPKKKPTLNKWPHQGLLIHKFGTKCAFLEGNDPEHISQQRR